MSEKPLIKENNRLREKLNQHNKEVYEDILVYIRLNYTSKNEETEEILNDLLTHIIEAQRNGKKIEEVTGKDYRTYADSIIEELPRRNVWKLAGKIALTYLGILYLFSYLMSLAFNIIDDAPLSVTIDVTAEIFYIVIMSLAGVGFVFLIFHAIQYTLFRNWPAWKEYGLVFIGGAISFLILMIPGFLKNAIDIGPSLEMSLWIPVLLGIILSASGLCLLFKPEKNAGRYRNK
ncbi:DUF1048 domain-containing protein [Salinicoccus carnicancri]|uniref:DUF1048 domain-containing protein n=1 Tax=Salinicoccus carnicancri TaxID=558170 RepID=UPI000308CA27|nr:DUF1048 domain-containing protein [Salinicoccus carnicancri]